MYVYRTHQQLQNVLYIDSKVVAPRKNFMLFIFFSSLPFEKYTFLALVYVVNFTLLALYLVFFALCSYLTLSSLCHATVPVLQELP